MTERSPRQIPGSPAPSWCCRKPTVGSGRQHPDPRSRGKCGSLPASHPPNRSYFKGSTARWGTLSFFPSSKLSLWFIFVTFPQIKMLRGGHTKGLTLLTQILQALPQGVSWRKARRAQGNVSPGWKILSDIHVIIITILVATWTIVFTCFSIPALVMEINCHPV